MQEKTENKLRKFLRPKQIEQLYGISRKTLANWRHQKKGPIYYKLGTLVFYPQKEFEEWLKKNAVLVKTTETL